MHLLHASFGIGATVGPLVMTLFLVGPGSWRAGYAVFALIQVALAAAFFRTRDRWGAVSPDTRGRGHPGLTGAIASGLVLFAVYTGLEVAAGQWAFSVLTEERGVAEGAAGFWVAGYWASLTVGRLLAGAAGDRISPERLAIGGMVTAVAGTIVFWLAPTTSSAVGGAGLLLVGFGLAPIFPMLILLTPRRVGPDRSTAVVGYQLAAAAVGAALLPGGVGLLVNRAGLEAVAPAMVVFALTMVAAAEITRRMPDASTPSGA
jgi:fucose permease